MPTTASETEAPPDNTTCDWSDGISNLAITGKNVKILHGIILTKCKQLCEKEPKCKSIEWRPKNNGCHLNSVSKDEQDLDSHPGFIYYDMQCVVGECFFVKVSCILYQF